MLLVIRQLNAFPSSHKDRPTTKSVEAVGLDGEKKSIEIDLDDLPILIALPEFEWPGLMNGYTSMSAEFKYRWWVSRFWRTLRKGIGLAPANSPTPHHVGFGCWQ